MAGGDHGSSDAAAELRRGFETLAVTRPDPSAGFYEVRLNRPAQRNALSPAAFAEIPRAMSLLDRLPAARAVVLSAAGPHFCAGIELGGPGNPLTAAAAGGADPAAAAEGLRRVIFGMQEALTAIERCRKPVIAAVHGACIGGGVDVVAACDIRCCSRDATFVLKEVDMAIVADLAVLQRLPAAVDCRLRERRRPRAHGAQNHRHGGQGDGPRQQGLRFQERLGCRYCKDRQRYTYASQSVLGSS